MVSLCRSPLGLQTVPLHHAECSSGLDGNPHFHRRRTRARQICVPSRLQQLPCACCISASLSSRGKSSDAPFAVVLLKIVLCNIFQSDPHHIKIASRVLQGCEWMYSRPLCFPPVWGLNDVTRCSQAHVIISHVGSHICGTQANNWVMIHDGVLWHAKVRWRHRTQSTMTRVGFPVTDFQPWCSGLFSVSSLSTSSYAFIIHLLCFLLPAFDIAEYHFLNTDQQVGSATERTAPTENHIFQMWRNLMEIWRR